MNFDDYKNKLPWSHKDKTAHRNEEARLRAIFEADAERELDFAHLPAQVKSKLHAIAWEQGHGYSEVFGCYPELVELAKDAYAWGKEQA